MYVIINECKFPIDTVEQYQAAVAAMTAVDQLTADVFDAEGEKTYDTIDTDPDPRCLALAALLNVEPLTVKAVKGSGNDVYESYDAPGEYRVLTSSERDDAACEALGSYLDECILSQIPEALRSYFDGDQWKEDALNNDGYGHTLSSYDGEEGEATIDGVCYYIYRVK